jgi:hypothetical protein
MQFCQDPRIKERGKTDDSGIFKPQTIAAAVELKEKFKDEAVFMAGGTDVNCADSKYEIEKVICYEALYSMG